MVGGGELEPCALWRCFRGTRTETQGRSGRGGLRVMMLGEVVAAMTEESFRSLVTVN